MVKRATLSPTSIRISKPGFNVDTATEDQLLIGAGDYPQAVLQAGTVFVTTAAPVDILFGIVLPWAPHFHIQGAAESGEGFVTFPAMRTSGNVSGVQSTIQPFTDRIRITTEFDRWIWYMIFNRQAA
ncbi:hypothetical protein IZ6_25030 [Terrihabitans soli]|uniref:Uncharacterized protein n=1 Tax=Terrihabitans soli TaxID=708113 RepID=A0A6S6QYU3_9HYPH|nr:hypothetical protein [Terrihabitans soli]BCJ91768.1 hypothetical protein IZ6_25030 [Terrihabitans soli]